MPVWTARCRNQDPGCVSITGCHKDAQPFFFLLTAISYPPTAIGYTPTAINYPPTAIGYTPTAISYPPTAIGYPPTAISYPPAAIIGRIGHSEFFFYIMATPGFYGGHSTGYKLGNHPKNIEPCAHRARTVRAPCAHRATTPPMSRTAPPREKRGWAEVWSVCCPPPPPPVQATPMPVCRWGPIAELSTVLWPSNAYAWT